MLSALATKILLEGSDDLVPVGALYGWAQQLAGDSEEEQRRAIVAALCGLISDGLIISGEVINGHGFVPRDGSLGDMLNEVQRRVMGGNAGDFGLWFANTGRGDSAVAQWQAANRKT